nr:WhiB family transcriptional regulator [Mycolicibacterium sphagni]
MEEWDWQDEGKCRGLPANYFFLEGLRGENLRSLEERAKLICRTCPVMQRCREHAIRTPEAYGIWGATTPRERAGHSLAATHAPVQHP